MSCLYVSQSYEDAKKWLDYFIKLGRPTFHIVKLKVEGNYFLGDATKCFRGTTSKEENLNLAHKYWQSNPNDGISEMLVDGKITD